MKKIIYTAGAIISLTALIGISLWATGTPAQTADGTALGDSLHPMIMFPLFWAGLSTLVTAPLLYAKQGRLTAEDGKASRIPTIGVLTPALACLLAQACVPFIANDLISKASAHAIFFYFMGSFFLLMGNYMIAVPFKSQIGFRTKATLSDAIVWARTHRFLGHSLVMTALICLPLPLLLGGRLAQWVLFGVVITIKLLSWLHARQLAARHTLPGAMTN